MSGSFTTNYKARPSLVSCSDSDDWQAASFCAWVPSHIKGRHIRSGYHSLGNSREMPVLANSSSSLYCCSCCYPSITGYRCAWCCSNAPTIICILLYYILLPWPRAALLCIMLSALSTRHPPLGTTNMCIVQQYNSCNISTSTVNQMASVEMKMLTLNPFTPRVPGH